MKLAGTVLLPRKASFVSYCDTNLRHFPARLETAFQNSNDDLFEREKKPARKENEKRVDR